MTSLLVRSALFACALLSACATQDPVALRACSADGGACQEPLTSYCAGKGPPPLAFINGQSAAACGGRVAADLFAANAACSCQPFSGSQPVTTDSYDSAAAPYAPGGTQGAVGINGRIDAQADWTVGGALTCAGITAIGTFTIAGDLRDGGALGGTQASVQVGGDAQVAGDVQLSALQVTGTLTLPPAAALTVTGTDKTGAVARAQVAVPTPCSCAAADLVDIVAAAAEHVAANDNAVLTQPLDRLDGFSGDITVDLPCGRFYATRIRGSGVLTLHVSGRAALYIGEAVDLTQNLLVRLDPAAELDLFLAGPVNTAGVQELGDTDAPGRVRIYVAGSGAIDLSAGARIGAALYAPGRDLAVGGAAEVFGALLVGRLLPTAALVVHRDLSIARLGDACP